jgi:hypothetical protein
VRAVNTERLHAVVDRLLTELAETDTPAILENLVNAFRQLPQDPAQQQTVADLRRRLEETLSEAPSNGFSPAWRRAIDELGVGDLFGTALLERVEEILTRNEMTPVAAADELAPIAERARGLEAAFNQTHESFAFLDIGEEVLGPDEFEVGFLIPRDAVHEEIDELANEMHKLSLILAPFNELVSGTRGEIRVRSISSSEFGVFVEVAPAVIELFSTALQAVLAAYEKLQAIRRGNAEFKKAGEVLNEETLEQIQKQVDSYMAKEIGVIVKELLAASRKRDSARMHELENNLERALNGLANRVAKNYTVEIRAPELPAPDDEGDGKPTPEQKKARKAAEVVHKAQQELVFPEPEGAPTLSLPEPTETRRRTRSTTSRRTTSSRARKKDQNEPTDG